MSLRYAHRAPDQGRVAVAKLNDRPVLALTMRLQWNGPRPMWRYRRHAAKVVRKSGLD